LTYLKSARHARLGPSETKTKIMRISKVAQGTLGNFIKAETEAKVEVAVKTSTMVIVSQ
jgi:hypothetical protein